MTEYTFKPMSTMQSVNWDNSSVWVNGVVPDGPDADVNFPLVTYVATGAAYISNVSILSNESYSVHSILLNDNLNISGALSTSGDFVENDGYLTVSGTLHVAGTLSESSNDLIQLNGGSISAQSLTDNGNQTQGYGQITAGTLHNSGVVVGGYGTLAINVTTLTNSGTIEAINGTTAITVPSGGLSNFSGGTLSGGSYAGLASGTLSLDIGGVISTDAANITLAGGTITSHDPVSGQDVPLTTSLHAIAASGSLTLTHDTSGFNTQAASYAFGPLNVAGKLDLSYAELTSSQLTVAPGGVLEGDGSSSVGSPVDNEGVVVAAQGVLALNGDVTGSGHLEVGYNSSLELGGATSETVIFTSPYADSPGTLQLDHPSTFSGSLTPTGHGDRIVLSDLSANAITSYAYSGDASGGTLTLQEQGGGSLAFTFNGNFTTSSFHLSAGPQVLSSDPPSLLITVGQVTGRVCFVAETCILTPHGEVAVERLKVGDSVITWSGAVREIVWIGSGTSRPTDGNPRSRPVVVRTGALADGVPCRDLRVTEGHSLYIDGMLIPAGVLVNGRSIHWDEAADSVAFHHVELPQHDILVADGAPAESYRDDGNRVLFSRTSGGRDERETLPFAPVLTEGPSVDAVWHGLVARMGGSLDRLTDDPDLHLIVDGERVEPGAVDGSRYRFLVPPAAREIMIGSRAVVPALVGTARDHRRLGVALCRITATTAGSVLSIDYASKLLTTGFHEPEHADRLRWTDGAARLPIGAFAVPNGCEMELEVACLARYAH